MNRSVVGIFCAFRSIWVRPRQDSQSVPVRSCCLGRGRDDVMSAPVDVRALYPNLQTDSIDLRKGVLWGILVKRECKQPPRRSLARDLKSFAFRVAGEIWVERRGSDSNASCRKAVSRHRLEEGHAQKEYERYGIRLNSLQDRRKQWRYRSLPRIFSRWLRLAARMPWGARILVD